MLRRSLSLQQTCLFRPKLGDIWRDAAQNQLRWRADATGLQSLPRNAEIEYVPRAHASHLDIDRG
jgi:hypothetical protein